MKERPILFSSPMVRAILEGRKTQTRRALVKQPLDIIPFNGDLRGIQWIGQLKKPPNPKGIVFRCRLGVPGDRLWVRETWRVGAWNEETSEIAVDYRATETARRQWLHVEDDELFERLWIQSSDDARDAGLKCGEDGYKWKPGESPCRWRPSIFMPRWASRITLEVTGVRVERLGDISEADARSEGILRSGRGWTSDEGQPISISARRAFEDLWHSINGAWLPETWVWALEFKRLAR